MVPATKCVTNFRKAVFGQFLAQRHGYLPGAGDGPGAPAGQEVGNTQLIILSHCFLNVFNRHQSVVNVKQISEHFLCKTLGNGSSGKAGIGEKRIQGALQVSYVRADPPGNEVGYRFFKEEASRS